MRGLSRAESAYGGSGVNPVTATSGRSGIKKRASATTGLKAQLTLLGVRAR